MTVRVYSSRHFLSWVTRRKRNGNTHHQHALYVRKLSQTNVTWEYTNYRIGSKVISHVNIVTKHYEMRTAYRNTQLHIDQNRCELPSEVGFGTVDNNTDSSNVEQIVNDIVLDEVNESISNLEKGLN